MNTPHEEMLFSLQGLAANFADRTTVATDAVIDAFNAEYRYPWQRFGVIAETHITFTGFKAANPFGEALRKRSDAWFLLTAQVAIFNKTTGRGVFENVYVDQRDPVWRDARRMKLLVDNLHRLCAERARREGWVAA